MSTFGSMAVALELEHIDGHLTTRCRTMLITALNDAVQEYNHVDQRLEMHADRAAKYYAGQTRAAEKNGKVFRPEADQSMQYWAVMCGFAEQDKANLKYRIEHIREILEEDRE